MSPSPLGLVALFALSAGVAEGRVLRPRVAHFAEAQNDSDSEGEHEIQYSNPVIRGDFPDPGAIFVDGRFYVATTGNDFPVHESRDLSAWRKAGFAFSTHPRSLARASQRHHLPIVPHPWATHDFWAPEIHRLPNGSFALHYTARAQMKEGQTLGQLSVGLAISDNVLGPYTDIGRPLAQPREDQYMYLDSNYFFDDGTSTPYLLWKQGTITPPEETRTMIYIQPMDSSGTALAGARQVILENDIKSWELGVVEAPWLVRPRGQKYYYLFYSAAHCCDGSGTYAVGVARAENITGPYERYSMNPILRRNEMFAAPGHCSVVPAPGYANFWVILYHAAIAEKNGKLSRDRHMLMDFLQFDPKTGWPMVLTDTRSPSVGLNKVPWMAHLKRKRRPVQE